jgi:hypothetical protein
MRDDDDDDDTESPLVVALEDNHPLTVLQDIVRDDPGLLQEQDEYGWMPLHHAAYENAPLPVIEWLADEYPEALLVQNQRRIASVSLCRRRRRRVSPSRTGLRRQVRHKRGRSPLRCQPGGVGPVALCRLSIGHLWR